VPLCHVHGADDDFVKYSELPPWIEKFAGVNKCQSAPKTTTGAKYKKDDYSPCENGNEVILYSIVGMKHAYATSASNGFSATDTFWAFFKRHPGASTGVANRASATRPLQSVFPGAAAGKIPLRSGEDVRSVRMFDVRGKAVLSWKASGGSARDCALPIGRQQHGVFLVKVSGATGDNLMTVMVP
jgi:hypothetical protein